MSFFNQNEHSPALLLPPVGTARAARGKAASWWLAWARGLLLCALPTLAMAQPPALEVLVAKVEIARHQPVTMQLLEWRTVNIGQYPRGVIRDQRAIEGTSARRRIRAGQVLSPSLLEPLLLVRRGEPVTVHAHHGPVQARTAGEALADGRKGSVIAVRNLGSGKIVQATVSAPGAVSITAP